MSVKIVKDFDVIVIGAGLAGLYALYKFSNDFKFVHTHPRCFWTWEFIPSASLGGRIRISGSTAWISSSRFENFGTRPEILTLDQEILALDQAIRGEAKQIREKILKFQKVGHWAANFLKFQKAGHWAATFLKVQISHRFAVGVLAHLNPVGGYTGIVGAALSVSFERCAKSLSKLTTVAQIEVTPCGVAWKGCQNGESRCLKLSLIHIWRCRRRG